MARRPTADFVGRVLVTEGEQRGALAACRSLARAGYDVAVVAGRRPAAAHWSSACRTGLWIADPRDSTERFVADLEGVVRKGGFSALLAGGECSLLPISDRRESLSPYLRLGLPDHGTLKRSLDKVALLEAAASAGLEPPASRVCEEPGEGHLAGQELGFPVVVKPCRSVLPSGKGLRQQPVLVVTRPSELEEAVARASRPYIVQRFEEHIPRLSCAGVMTGDGVAGLVVVRFLRTWPPLAGAVCFGETVPFPSRLHERVELLLRALGWRGIFELELLDHGAGRLAAIDFNPRIFGWLALAIASGADLPLLWLQSLLGGSGQATEPRLGVCYRWEDADLAHLGWQLRRRHLRAAAEVLRPRRGVVHAHFRLDDPGPLFARFLELGRRRDS